MRIIKIPADMTFEEFKEKHGKMFLISNADKRESAMEKEYKKLSKKAQRIQEKEYKAEQTEEVTAQEKPKRSRIKKQSDEGESNVPTSEV